MSPRIPMLTLLGSLLALQALANPSPNDLLVVVHAGVPEQAVDVDMLREIFQARRSNWSDGSHIHPINASQGSRLRAAFRNKVLRISKVEEETFWKNMQIRQGTIRPDERSSPIRAVRRKAGAIGYVFRSDFDPSGVKIVAEFRAYDYLEPERQVQVLAKVLGYENSIQDRASDGLKLGILYSTVHGQSEATSMKQLFNGLSISGHPVELVMLNTDSPAAAGQALQKVQQGLDLAYLTAGLDPWMKRIKAAASQNQVLLLTGQAAYLWEGAAVGVVSQNGKPSILINLESAKDQGGRPDPRLLKIATVIR